MAVPKDPKDWTPQQRGAVLGAELDDWLREIPTARTVWAEGPETTAARDRRAAKISKRMDRIIKEGR